MKFLLVGINSKYIHSNPAVYALKSYLKTNKEAVEIAEYTINQELSQIRSDIFQRTPDAIGFSCYIWNIRYVMELSRDIALLMPNIAIWLGGPEVSYRAVSLLKGAVWIRGIIVGEGEAPFAALLSKMTEKDNCLDGIKGLVYRDREGILHDNGMGTPVSFARSPFLYEGTELPQNRIIYYETSRGCPFRCSYCLSSVDKKIRLRDLDLVFSELSLFLKERVPQVKLIDRTFNCVPKRARAIWNYLLENDNGMTNFHFEIGADLLTEEDFIVLSRMRKGLVQFEIGVQTTNPQTLQAICRNADQARIFSAVKRIASFGNIHQHLDLIAGLPYEGYESFGKSFDDVYQLKPDQLQMGFLKVLSGTKMEAEAEQYGIIHASGPPYEVLSTKWLSYTEICRLKQIEEAVETFYNSGQFVLTLQYLETKMKHAFSMYEQLADWYFAVCKDGGKPGRRRLYEYLFQCLGNMWPKEMTLWGQLLCFDYYSRDNTGTRLSFFKKQSEWKEQEKLFYIEETKDRKYLKGYEAYDSKQMQHMTQFEQFDWDFLRYMRDGNLMEKNIFLIFDYRNRDFRTGNAEVILLEP